MAIADYIKQLLSNEAYSFSFEELIANTNKTEISIKSVLSRLISKKEIINLRKGFYLILPPRYSSAQKLPIQLYCEKLFKHLNRNYYVALFSAAKFHGASHQQVQRDYFMTEQPKLNDILKKTIDIRFFTTSKWTDKNIQLKRSDAGVYKISGPALTIVDLIHYQSKLGGINRVLSTIVELSEELNEADLTELLSWYPNKSALQRFGFLLEDSGICSEYQEKIYNHINNAKLFPVLLSPKSDVKPGAVENKWKVVVNVKLERKI